jgi:hypothetical protein
MANIDEELRLASEATDAIATKPREILEILRKAAFMAQVQQTTMMLSSEPAINKAPRKAAIALANLIPALEANRETPTRMKKAKVALDKWIMQIKVARP